MDGPPRLLLWSCPAAVDLGATVHARRRRARRGLGASGTALRRESPSAASRSRGSRPAPARSGSGERTSTRLAGHRVRERQPGGVQELALQPEPPAASRTGGSPHTGWPIAAMWTRIWWVRPVSSDHPQQRAAAAAGARSRSGCGPRAARRCRSTSARGRAGGARSGRRSCPCAPADGRRPAPGTRAAAARRPAAAFSARWTASFLATTSRPEVSRSSRCTIPARHGSSPPAARPVERLGERPGPVAARGVHHHAGGLVDHQQVLVLVGDRERRRLGRAGPPDSARSRSSTSIASPAATRWRLGRSRPSTRTRPRVDQRLGSRPGAERAGQEPVEPGAGGLRRERAARGSRARSALAASRSSRRPAPEAPRAPTAARARRT